jgi:ATP-binding cassette subfamily F protein uup
MAERLLISLEDVSLTFGGKPLFEGVSLHVSEGDKICLVGRNGAGKTTLMRMLMGELDLDAGKHLTAPGIRMGYLAQQVIHQAGDTVRQFVLSGLPDSDESEEKHYLADIIMEPLALHPEARMGTLSGGQLRRAALARALIEEPDVLLLDEPTNHLDLGAIEWLESYLNAYRGALICVSHDRTFLANVSRKVFWIDRGTIRTSPAGYREFEEWAAGILELEARTLHNMQKKLELEESWTQGGVTARRKRNQRRVRELIRLREKLKIDRASYKMVTSSIELDPLTVTQASKIVCEFKNVSKAFVQEGKSTPILTDFHFRILRGDRIGILGRNGSGKSTFLKLLIGEMEPDSGYVKRGKTIEIAYFDQNRVELNPKLSLWKTLCPGGGDHVFLGGGENQKPRHVCGYLKDFLFDPKIARDLVGTLSGGQQNRLMLAKILANPGNVLILDEPTNDLDMDTLDMLQEILSDYQGTLIIVSHDRDFLDRTVTSVLAFEGDAQVEGYVGGYTDYLEAKTKQRGGSLPKAAEKSKVVSPTPAKQEKITFKIKFEWGKLPAKIELLEAEITALKTQLADPDLYVREPNRFDTVATRLSAASLELSTAEHRWLELSEMMG